MNFDHLSVSHVNDFISRRPKWFLTRVKNMKFPVGVEAHRGSAVERGVVHGLVQKAERDQCVAIALQGYDELTADMDIEDAAKCRAPIPGLVEALLDTMAGFVPISTQKRCGMTSPVTGSIPWVGYTDLEDDSCVVDIKTKSRTPSELPGDWRRQGAFYSKATGKPARFVCGIPNKVIGIKTFDLTPEDVERGWSELQRAADAMFKLLDLSPEVLSAACLPDPDDWMIARDKMFAHAVKEVWNL